MVWAASPISRRPSPAQSRTSAITAGNGKNGVKSCNPPANEANNGLSCRNRPDTAATPSWRQLRQASTGSRRPAWIWPGYFGSRRSGTFPSEK